MKFSKINLSAGICLIVLSLVLLSQAMPDASTTYAAEDIDPMAYPRTLLYLLMACGIIIAVKKSASACAYGDGIPFISWRIVLCCVTMLLYAVLINILGFAVSSFLAATALALTMGWRNIGSLIWINALGVGLCWLFFRYVLKIVLPTGYLV